MSKKKSLWSRFKKLFCGSEQESNQQTAPPTAHLDNELSESLQKWSNKYKTNEKENAFLVASLKSQLERYEMELALRKLVNKMPKNKRKHRKEFTDDKLPYELKPISSKWKSAISRLNQLKYAKAIEKSDKIKRTDKSSTLPTLGASDKLIAVSLSSVTEFPTTETLNGEKSQDFTRLPVESADLGVEIAQIPEDENFKDDSTTTSEDTVFSANSSFAKIERTGHLTDLLMDIMKDAEGNEPCAKEDLSSEQLAALSRDDPCRFEHVVLENTKQSLLISQPTGKEIFDWDNPTRIKPQKKLTFSKQYPEVRTFCDCPPRHWNRQCTKRTAKKTVVVE